MAMTAAERKRRQLDREQEGRRVAPDSTYPYLKTPFHEWLGDGAGDWSGVWFDLNAAGFDLPAFDDDSGPKSIDGEVERSASGDYNPYAGYEGSIGRAESMVDYLLSAVQQFASTVNLYKLEQIDARIADLQIADLSDPAAKKQALDDIVRLTRMRELLDKNVRISLRQWKVKGV